MPVRAATERHSNLGTHIICSHVYAMAWADGWCGGGGEGQHDGKALSALVIMWRDNKKGLLSPASLADGTLITPRWCRILYANSKCAKSQARKRHPWHLACGSSCEL